MEVFKVVVLKLNKLLKLTNIWTRSDVGYLVRGDKWLNSVFDSRTKWIFIQPLTQQYMDTNEARKLCDSVSSALDFKVTAQVLFIIQ